MNRDQQFVFQIALKTIQTFIENPTNYEPLRMIVSGTGLGFINSIQSGC
jgi:hypothetical protein